jgi:hypothetical protein
MMYTLPVTESNDTETETASLSRNRLLEVEAVSRPFPTTNAWRFHPAVKTPHATKRLVTKFDNAASIQDLHAVCLDES